MQIQWRPNPKTPDGWPKRIAIALLSGLAVFILSSPVAFFLFLGHFETASPKDTQNILSALTAAVVCGVALAGLTAFLTLSVRLLLGFLRPTSNQSV